MYFSCLVCQHCGILKLDSHAFYKSFLCRDWNFLLGNWFALYLYLIPFCNYCLCLWGTKKLLMILPKEPKKFIRCSNWKKSNSYLFIGLMVWSFIRISKRRINAMAKPICSRFIHLEDSQDVANASNGICYTLPYWEFYLSNHFLFLRTLRVENC